MGEGLVLEWAFAAFVTDRAVEGVVDQQELDNSLLRLLHHFGPGVDHHSVGDDGGARR